MRQQLDESSEWEFDPNDACEAIQDEMNWQIQEWERERMEEVYG